MECAASLNVLPAPKTIASSHFTTDSTHCQYVPGSLPAWLQTVVGRPRPAEPLWTSGWRRRATHIMGRHGLCWMASHTGWPSQ